MADNAGLSAALDGIPMVADAAARDARFPLATRKQNQRVFRLDSGVQQRWSGSVWVDDSSPLFNVRHFGAAGDGTTDDTSAIQAAITAASVSGGEVYFPAGRYKVVATGTVSLPVPVSNGFAASSQSLAYHFYLHDVTGVSFKGDNATIVSTVTSGGEVFLLNGVRDFQWDGITIQSVFAASGGTVTTAGMNALAFTSTTRESYNIRIGQYSTLNCFTSLYVFGDAGSSYRVREMTVGTIQQDGGEYGVALHNNGDNVVIDAMRCVNVNSRPFFFYGVSQVRATIRDGAGTGASGGFSALIKSYDRDTTDVTVHYRTARNTTVPKLVLQSQHDPVAQPTPGQLRNISVDFSDVGTTGPSIEFEYFQNAVLTATTSSLLFDNVRLAGTVVNDVTTTVTQAAAVRSYLNVDDLKITSGALTILQNKGFYRTQYRSWVPALTFGGGATGMTYTTRVGECYVHGNLVTCHAHLVLSAKGSSTGAAQITAPFTPADYTLVVPVVQGVGSANLASLTGVIVGTVTTNGFVNLMQQGAAGTSNLTEAHFTNTSDLLVTFTYLI